MRAATHPTGGIAQHHGGAHTDCALSFGFGDEI